MLAPRFPTTLSRWSSRLLYRWSWSNLEYLREWQMLHLLHLPEAAWRQKTLWVLASDGHLRHSNNPLTSPTGKGFELGPKIRANTSSFGKYCYRSLSSISVLTTRLCHIKKLMVSQWIIISALLCMPWSSVHARKLWVSSIETQAIATNILLGTVGHPDHAFGRFSSVHSACLRAYYCCSNRTYNVYSEGWHSW